MGFFGSEVGGEAEVAQRIWWKGTWVHSHLSSLQIQTSRFQIHTYRLQIHTFRLTIQTSRLPSWARNLEAFMALLRSPVLVPVPALLFAHSGIDSSMLCNDLFDERPKMLRRPKHNV